MPRRRGRKGGRAQTLLPISASRDANSLSIWYCDFKLYIFNDLLFSFGSRYSGFLKIWFTAGVGFSLLVFFGITMMLICESVGAFNLYSEVLGLRVPNNWLFGSNFVLPVWSVSILDTVIVVFSTIFCVAIHEFGHAVAAASEGLRIEYVAIFLAVLFPGALVSLRSDLLECLPRLSALRIYCAGIWHNLIICAVCQILMILLPSILSPFYIHDHGPIVLSVPQASPLSEYLSPGDVITSVDGSYTYSPYDWIQKMTEAGSFNPDGSGYSVDSFVTSSKKGYCVTDSLITSSFPPQTLDSQLPCPDDFYAFLPISCSDGHSVGNVTVDGEANKAEIKICLIAKDVVKMKKCGVGWHLPDESKCSCHEEEHCMVPILRPGTSWVEISYSSPYSSACLERLEEDQWPKHSAVPESVSTPCGGGTFVFIGNMLSAALSVKLSRYRPTRRSLPLGSNLPVMLEKILACTCQVSAALGLLNSLPVFFLDGEAILETGLRFVAFLNPRRQRRVLWFCLAGGTLLSVISVCKALYFMLSRPF